MSSIVPKYQARLTSPTCVPGSDIEIIGASMEVAFPPPVKKGAFFSVLFDIAAFSPTNTVSDSSNK